MAPPEEGAKLNGGAEDKYTLGKRLGEGGEGKVFHILGQPELVGKIYKPDPEMAERILKISEVVLRRTEHLDIATAWPVDILKEKGTVVGFLMPFLAGYESLFSVYQCKSRLSKFPRADWKFLVRIAKNLATAVHYVHEAGVVIGDLNESNTLVDGRAMVRLIDADSFQLAAGTKLYPCGVAKSELLAPELHGLNLDKTERTKIHDCFPLAILLFQIMMLGRHPFAGSPKGDEEFTLEEAIQNHWYIFSHRDIPQNPPPYLTATILPPTIRNLFQRAFDGEVSERPSAREWHTALTELEGSLQPCPRDPTHVHWGIATCPWCELENKWRVKLFAASSKESGIGAGSDDPTDTIEDLQKWLDGLRQGVSRGNFVNRNPVDLDAIALASEGYDSWRLRRKHKRLRDAFLGLLVFFAVSQGRQLEPGTAIMLITVSLIIGGTLLSRYSEKIARSTAAREKYDSQLEKIKKLKREWSEVASPTLYQRRVRQLARQANRLAQSEGTRSVDELLGEQYAEPLKAFLKKYSLLASPLDLEDQKKLMEQGVKTAADVFVYQRKIKPALSPKEFRALLDWVQELRTVYLKGKPLQVTQAELERRDARERSLKIAEIRSTVEGELQGLRARIMAAQSDIERRQTSLIDEMERAAKEYVDACLETGQKWR